MMQQLYIFGGLLIIYASVNAFPLKTLTRLARVGAVWQVAGKPQSLAKVICVIHVCIGHQPSTLTLTVIDDWQRLLFRHINCVSGWILVAGAFVAAVTVLVVAE